MRYTPRQLIALARADLRRVGVHVPRGVRIRRDLVTDHWGEFVIGDRVIRLHYGLTGAGLYRTLIHEIGHALGLDHTRRGIMASADCESAVSAETGPYLEQRRRWCADLARSALKRRLRDWRKASA